LRGPPPFPVPFKFPSLEGCRGGFMRAKKILPYNPKLKERARELRKNSTLSEVLLWGHIKGKQISGYDFDRQKPIDNFIVDFFCNELMLAIEIDGETHNYRVSQDRERQMKLEGLGVRFLRFTDEEVKRNIGGVLSVIENWVANPPLHPSQEGIYSPPGSSAEET
jgi:very-short-patch-repair endonuclease